MNSIPLPDDMIGLIAVLIIVVGGWVPVWLSHRGNKRLRNSVDEVQNQVQNNHSTNLRDDIDAIHVSVRGVSRDVAQLRGELRDERTDRIAADKAINEHIQIEIQRHPSAE